MQSKGNLFLLLVIGLAALSGFLFTKKPYQFGLDVKGGVRLTYRMKTEDLKPDQKSNLALTRSLLIKVLEDRVSQGLGVVEGTVQAKGDEEFIVEVPGSSDINAVRKLMSSTASIKCYWAKNVRTAKMTFRNFERGAEELVDGSPVITFTAKNLNKTLKPTDQGYKDMIAGWELILEGSDLAQAQAQVDGTRTIPSFKFAPSGATKLETWCRRVENTGENMAFVLDGRVLSIAPLKDGAILSDNAIIDGQFEPAYVNGLVKLLNAGALPVGLEETSSQQVDPTIGTTALDMMVKAGIIAFGVIALYLLAYYAVPGFAALIALALYILFTLTVMKWIGATFSLAGIAGFILSVGMAVDANILVFERTKEEMRDGRSLLTAVELGFKRALPAIVDSNACTLLTSLVLVQFGTGPVKGFATSLIIGVLISLFTAVTVTRSLLVFMVGNGLANNPKTFALDRQWFGNFEKDDSKMLDVVHKYKKFFLISLITIVVGIPFIFMGGLKPNVEFQGGIEARYGLGTTGLTTPQIVGNLEKAGVKGGNVKVSTINGQRFANVTVPPSERFKGNDPNSYAEIGKAAGLEPLPKPEITAIGPTVQAETLGNAIKAVIISTTLIVLYLAFRFGLAVGGMKNGIRFGMSAVGALLHDILVLIGLAAIVGYFMGWEISALFITSTLTVIGFSVHDTIVIFDRIRENLRRPVKGEDFAHLCNRSISQSFARSINTSMTVLVTLLILLFFGSATADLKFFCLAMFIGILSGTYSSIYNATPLLYLWDRQIERKKGHAHTLIAEATAEADRLRAAAMAMGAVAPPTAPIGAGPSANTPNAAGRGYGQIKRRDSVIDRSKQEIDED